jgi:hypothetical protein
MSTKPTSALHINEDLAFERREWFVQRIGWGVLALITLLALGGAFGKGPMSSAEAGDPNVLRAEYQRFVRHSQSMQLQVSVAPLAVKDSQVELSVSREYLEKFTVEQIIPEPERVENTADALLFVFNARESQVPLKVTFTLEPEQLGWHSGSIALQTGAPVKIEQFTYP